MEADVSGTRQIVWESQKQRTQPEPRNRDAQHSARQGQHNAFRQQLPHHAASGRTERRAYAKFTCARDGARQQQAGNIRASNEQNKTDSAKQQQDRSLYVADDLLLQRSHHDPDAAVRVRILTVKVRLNRVHFGLGLSHCHARFEAREHCDCVHRTLPKDGGHVRAQRSNDVRVGKEMEARREHSHDCKALAIQDGRASYDALVCAKSFPPEPIAYETDWRRVHQVIR
jgi:hypothetical protein